MNDRREIPLNKKKLVLVFLGSMIFVVAGVWMIAVIGQLFAIIVGYVAILFGGSAATVCIFKLLDNKPGLIISKTGLTDNSSWVAAGEIPWSDIRGISAAKISGQNYIFLYVDNPEQYINRQKNSIRRYMVRQTFNMYGTPLAISLIVLKIRFDELLEILDEYYIVPQL